ncbi:hypothetical protein THAOC_04421 [Thalassiosira oceanica]|uniref:Uncharacterized protein n=1 Tax=Thalassiosira oceanica TaxID=159749 RepID=K0TNX2_THAOC|nr:hypothetical protein THAOC_04421 [Thalassiosira oceanica]|eukprot:EJK73932.1 hypothetical protein THAOC_04421 [Thalassiosira oceanica]
MTKACKSVVVISPPKNKENNSRTPSKSKGGFRPVLPPPKRRGRLAAPVQGQETVPSATKQTARHRQQHPRTTISHRQSIHDDADSAETQNEDNSLSHTLPKDPLAVDDCLALLKLRRPLEPKTEFGLAEGIGMHLSENIKLSGLRKARETSLLEMVKTLTHHLENREETISIWVSFADKVALLSARQIHAAQQEIKDLTEAKRRSYSALLSMQTQVKQANSAVKDTLCDINSTITRLKDEVVKELCLKFKQRALTEREAIQAESKCQRGDELEELALQHENQVKHLQDTISNLEASLASTTDETNIAKDGLKLANEEIVKLNAMVESSQVKFSELRNSLDKKVKTLQKQIEDNDKKKEQELMDKDNVNGFRT